MILCQFFAKLRSCYFYGDKRAMYLLSLFNIFVLYIFVISIKSRPSFDLVIYISRYGSLHNYRTIKSENEIDETNVNICLQLIFHNLIFHVFDLGITSHDTIKKLYTLCPLLIARICRIPLKVECRKYEVSSHFVNKIIHNHLPWKSRSPPCTSSSRVTDF